MKIALLASAALVLAVATPAWSSEAAAQLPLAPARTLSLEVERGTWLSLDVSPDGKTIVFDMLGDLYAAPVEGGTARQLTRGLAFDTQPTFSPDGQWIAFVSDRSGADNLWIARAAGSQARQVSDNADDSIFTSPAWSADGQALFASHYRPDVNNYALWRYSLDGKGQALAPVKPAAGAARTTYRSTLGASASPDGRYLYYARRVGGLDFDAAKRWTILRQDLATGEEQPVIAGAGGRGAESETFFRPVVSGDGRKLAYATRVEGRTRLRVRDLVGGQDIDLGEVEADALQASSWQDLLPRYAFMPDGQGILVAHGGRIERRSLTGAITSVPLHVSAKVDVGPSTRVRLREADGPVRAHLAMAPIASPDGRRVAFAALGGLYVQPLYHRGPARRLPVDAGLPAQPSWSPDGKTLVYVSWSEADGGAVWTIRADGSGPARRLDLPNAFYTYPVFTPDGRAVLTVRSAAAARRQSNFEFGKLREGELMSLPTDGRPARVLTSGRLGARPHFSAKPGKVYILTGEGLAAVDLASGARERVLQVKGPGYYFAEGTTAVDDMRISPDGRSVAALIVQQLYVVPIPAGATPEVDLTDPRSVHRRVTKGGADYFEWTPDGDLTWSAGADFVRIDPATGAERKRTALAAELPRERGGGSIVLRGARALTMAHGDQIIEDADILVRDGRIAAIGPRGSVAIPAGASVRDLSGKIVLPGFIDTHDHIGTIKREVLSAEDWGLRARLAFGVTTSFDPSTLSIDMVAYQDLIDAGLVLGPRLRSTGPALFSMQRFVSLDDARTVLGRYQDGYGLSNLKEYRTGNRRVRQWVAMAARERGMLPTTEGALSLKLDLTQILDGYAGNEHALPAPALGDDVIGLLAAMRTSYTTTLSVTNSGGPAVDWFVTQRDPAHDARVRRFWTPSAIEQKLGERPWQALERMRFPAIAEDAAAVQAASGLVGIGAHGEAPGIGFHWEMEAHVMGGMGTLATLHAATAGSAETIGRLDDLGTLELGKLADLVVLDRDPVADIRNSQSVSLVMRDGRLFTADTLEELWPRARPAPRAWFARGGADPWLPTSKP